MAVPRDRTAFLAANRTRLRIAQWCRDERLSRDEIARRLDRPSGSLSAPNTMLRRGALMDAGVDEAGRTMRGAQLLRLNPAWEDALHEALRLLRPGGLESGADLLLIPLASTGTACAVLAGHVDEIDWGVQLDGEQMGLMLSPHRDADNRATIRAVAALDRAGIRPVRIRLQTPMAAAELQEWALGVVGEDRRSLLPGE